MTFTNEDMALTNYLFTFTDDVGIFQHSKYGIPDRNFGYKTDDNARALILAVILYEEYCRARLPYRFRRNAWPYRKSIHVAG